MEKSDYRFYIQVRRFQGVDALKIFQELYSFDKDSAPSHSTVKRWCKAFDEGRTSLEDDPRSGRPIVETTEVNVARVKA